jgi:23S rRNA pseudouridine1911/1915/1917 synthase
VPLAVLFRDSSLAVVDKPAGLPVEADSQESVVALAARELGPKGGRAFPRVVHRLDRDTSGCLALALSDAGRAALQRAFDDGLVEKEYLALVAGGPPDEGSCDTPYGRDPRDARRFTTRLQTPRRARLKWHVLERRGERSLLRVVLDTGRTHQIRVQLSEAGYPVIGDAVYGVPGAARQLLHAARLSFPVAGRRVECEAPLPADFEAALHSAADT